MLKGYRLRPALMAPLLSLMSRLGSLLSEGTPAPAEQERLPEALPPFEEILLRPLSVLEHEPVLPDPREQLGRLLAFPHADRLAFARAACEFHRPCLAERLCEDTLEAARNRRVTLAGELAELALEVADLVDHKALRAYACAHVAYARVFSDRLKQADLAIARSRSLWEGVQGYAGLDPGRLLAIEASLRRAQRRLPDALTLLARAEAIGFQPGPVLFEMASLLEHMGEFDRALRTLDRAESRLILPDTRERFLLLLLRGMNLSHLHRYPEALALSEEAITLAPRLDNRLDLLRAVWLHARVTAGLGQDLLAADLFQILRSEFRRESLHHEVALVSVELTALVLGNDSPQDLGFLADLPAALETLPVSPAAAPALQAFCDAIRRGTPSVGLARDLAALLHRETRVHFPCL